jgi:hypothetical protein
MNVTIDASVSVSRRRPDQHNRGDEQDGDDHADRRSGLEVEPVLAGLVLADLELA